MDFPDEYFDIVCSRQSLYLIPRGKEVSVLQEIDRVLKKGGKIIFYETKKYRGRDMSEAKDFFENKGYTVNTIEFKKRIQEKHGLCILFGEKRTL